MAVVNKVKLTVGYEDYDSYTYTFTRSVNSNTLASRIKAFNASIPATAKIALISEDGAGISRITDATIINTDSVIIYGHGKE